MEYSLTGFDSELWETYRGAYGNIKDFIEILMNSEETAPELQKINRMDHEQKDNYWVAFDNLCENLWHQLSFYDGVYLAMPYMVELLKKKEQSHNFKWQFMIIGNMGDCLSTDYKESSIDNDIIRNYKSSVKVLQDKTKAFILDYLADIKELEKWDKLWFATSILAILGDRKVAYVLGAFTWESCYLVCKECDYCDEDLELSNEEQLQKIQPAESVIGKWDRVSYENTYLWFSNLLHLFETEEGEKLLSYYFGTYTCPECGTKAPVIELASNYLCY